MVDQPGVYTAKAVHERFLRAPGLRLLAKPDVVRDTIKKALAQGKIVVRVDDGIGFRAYDARGCVEGPPGNRRRSTAILSTFALHDNVLVTLPTTPYATEWLKEDAGEGKTGNGPGPGPWPPPLPLPPSQVTAETWEHAIAYAAERPLAELRLVATRPADAAKLLGLAQPFGATALRLDVKVGGPLKDGGHAHLSIAGVKPAHPTKPLEMARTLHTAMGDAALYEAALTLSFDGAGPANVGGLLEQARADAPADLGVRATFGPAQERAS